MTDAPAPPTEPATPKVAPVIDSSVPLSQQAGKLQEIYNKMPVPKDEVPKEPPTPPTPPAEPETPPEPLAPVEPPEPTPSPSPAPIEEEDDEPLAPPVDLGPVEKYIYDRLPNITTRILDANGNSKTVQIKDASELPAGFKFADDSASAQFSIDIAAQVGKAKDALNEYRQKEMNENIKQWETQEAQDVAADLARLQKQNIIPAFKYDEDDPNFNTDPAVKTANEIYDLYKKTNDAYAKKYANTSRTFRISYADAADKYFAAQNRANNSQVAKDQPTPKEPTPIQKERQQIAQQQGAPQGGEPGTGKPKVKSGMSFDDINRMARAGRI